MNFTSKMLDRLHEISRIESAFTASELDVPTEQLCTNLIALYYQTEQSRTRVLVTQLLADAGGDWLHQLVTAQPQQYKQSEYQPTGAVQYGLKTASLNDYLTVLAANDDFEQSVQQFYLAG